MPSRKKSSLIKSKAWWGSDERLKALLEGSHVIAIDEQWDRKTAWEEWEEGRRFIASAINKNGTILDYGCANGFLLRSLQEWSKYKLEPYGLDVDGQALTRARELFSDIQDHFISLEEQKKNKNFPKSFDFVYWNVWDNFKLEGLEATRLLQKLQVATKAGGRLILGFYDIQKGEASERVAQLKKLGLQLSGILKSPTENDLLVWFDKAV